MLGEEDIAKCACCGDEVDAAEIVVCLRCGRRVCAGCLLALGQAGSVCEDCAEGEEDDDLRDSDEREEWDDEEEDEDE